MPADHTIPDRIAVLERYHAALLQRMDEDREHLVRLDRKLGTYRDIVAAHELTPEHIIGEPAAAGAPASAGDRNRAIPG